MNLGQIADGRRWLVPALPEMLLRSLRPHRRRGQTHLILAIADHFEPHACNATDAVAQHRVDEWVDLYPRVLGHFRDCDGRPPRHTFFYPIETYTPGHIDALASLCRRGFGEVEIHLHHDNDTAENLRETLRQAVRTLSDRHGLLARRETGAIAYGFVHGNWALDNARPDGRWCGVNDEIRVLRETGCYADFTYPSAPSPTQPPTINRIYRATSCPDRPRGHDRAIAGTPEDALMLIPGPLVLNPKSRRFGLLPRLENACVQASQPATPERLELWLRARVCVAARPDWFFVKLHAHGALEHDRDVLIGPRMAAFHEALAQRAAADRDFHVHYVTAREMYNLVRAAESGWQGPVNDARDFELAWNADPAPLQTPGRCCYVCERS